MGQSDIGARGANFQLGWYGDCAYVGTAGQPPQLGATSPSERERGVAVIDASDPRNPELVRVLSRSIGRDQMEALEVNQRRGMLVFSVAGFLGRWLEIYDVSGDCRDPRLVARYDSGAAQIHGLRISDDGRTIYATNPFPAITGPVLHAIDVADMARPRLITRWDPSEEDPPRLFGIHDLEVSPDGRRAYLGTTSFHTQHGPGLRPGLDGRPTTPSMVVIDTSEIQARRRHPDIGIVSDVQTGDAWGHGEQRARIGGRAYLLSSGELNETGAAGCPWEWGHILDMRDDTRPRQVAQLKLEVNEVSNCNQTGRDDAEYSIHYGGVDDDRDATMAFYAYFSSGLRVLDIRDPHRPKEIAYYNPPPKPTRACARRRFRGDTTSKRQAGTPPRQSSATAPSGATSGS